jgi:hypothetical protein
VLDVRAGQAQVRGAQWPLHVQQGLLTST